MMVDWLKPYTGEDRAKYERELRSSTFVIQRLKELIEEYDTEVVNTEERNMAGYDKPAWPYKQAHVNGRRQELNRFRQLMNLD